MRKVAIVDLDKVLFNSEHFKNWYFEDLRNCFGDGFAFNNVEFTYKNAKSDGWYNTDLHFRELEKISGKSSFELTRWVERFFVGLQDSHFNFLFSDAELFLQFLGSQGYEVHILTLGIEWFQKAKIESVGLLRYISGYTVTQNPTKCSDIKGLCDPTVDKIVLFDDSKVVVDTVKLMFPKIVTIQILRDGNSEKISESADAVAKNLEEAMDALLAR